MYASSFTLTSNLTNIKAVEDDTVISNDKGNCIFNSPVIFESDVTLKSESLTNSLISLANDDDYDVPIYTDLIPTNMPDIFKGVFLFIVENTYDVFAGYTDSTWFAVDLRTKITKLSNRDFSFMQLHSLIGRHASKESMQAGVFNIKVTSNTFGWSTTSDIFDQKVMMSYDDENSEFSADVTYSISSTFNPANKQQFLKPSNTSVVRIVKLESWDATPEISSPSLDVGIASNSYKLLQPVEVSLNDVTGYIQTFSTYQGTERFYTPFLIPGKGWTVSDGNKSFRTTGVVDQSGALINNGKGFINTNTQKIDFLIIKSDEKTDDFIFECEMMYEKERANGSLYIKGLFDIQLASYPYDDFKKGQIFNDWGYTMTSSNYSLYERRVKTIRELYKSDQTGPIKLNVWNKIKVIFFKGRVTVHLYPEIDSETFLVLHDNIEVVMPTRQAPNYYVKNYVDENVIAAIHMHDYSNPYFRDGINFKNITYTPIKPV